LRERKEDVSMLTRHFLQQSAKQLGVEPKRISDAALVWLEGFAFPGNVRQLENICHWLTVMAPAQMIEAKDLPPEVGVSNPDARANLPVSTPALPVAIEPALADSASIAPVVAQAPAPMLALEGGWEAALEDEAVALLGTGRLDVWDALTRRFESRLIHAALANTKGRRIEAAHKLGIGRNTITRKIQELGLE
jgi:two-component system nitrogen regulation response regulator GlnG